MLLVLPGRVDADEESLKSEIPSRNIYLQHQLTSAMSKMGGVF